MATSLHKVTVAVTCQQQSLFLFLFINIIIRVNKGGGLVKVRRQSSAGGNKVKKKKKVTRRNQSTDLGDGSIRVSNEPSIMNMSLGR